MQLKITLISLKLQNEKIGFLNQMLFLMELMTILILF
jgi:hypothetical protein